MDLLRGATSVRSSILSCRSLAASATYLPTIWGLGGRDVTVDDQVSVVKDLIDLHETNSVSQGRTGL